MVGRTLFVFLLLFSAAGAAPGKDPKADPKFIGSVEASIAKGVDWLLSKQQANGRWAGFTDSRGETYELGMHALATLAVIKGAGNVEDKRIVKALRALRTLYDRHRARLYTYEVGVTLMVLDAKYHAAPPRIDPRKPIRKPKKFKVSAKDQELVKALTIWLQTKQKPAGFWRYPEAGMDLSNTQYAMLGLFSAHRLGGKVDAGMVRRTMEETLKRQQKDGPRVPFILDPRLHKHGGQRRSATTIPARGWRYMPAEEVSGKKVVYPYSGSMTSAGVAVLAIGRNILGPKQRWLKTVDAEVRRSMWEGLAWMQAHWDLLDNPGQPGNWPFYWIYGLERAGQLCGVEYVGGHDWYHEGCLRLIADQRGDGSWPKNQRMRPPGDQNVKWWSDQVDTCFALLFLTKSTPGIETPPPVISGN